MDKTNVIIYSVVGLVVIGLVIYSVKTFSKKETTVQQDFSVPEVVLSESKNEYQSKLEKANAREPIVENVVANDGMEFKTYQSDSTPVVEEPRHKKAEKTVSYTTVKKPVKKQAYHESNTSTTKVDNSKSTNEPVKKYQQSKEETNTTQTVDPYTNYGISVNKTSSSNSNSGAASISDNLFYEAFLLADTRIKNGSQVVFILNKDYEISGVKFKRMSRIFAVATYSKNNVNIIANMIQNTNGQKYPISIVGYNENFQPGIFNNSKVDEAVNEGSNEFVDDAVVIPTSEIQFVSSALNAAGKATKEAFKKEPEINISEGYKMYFKLQTETK